MRDRVQQARSPRAALRASLGFAHPFQLHSTGRHRLVLHASRGAVLLAWKGLIENGGRGHLPFSRALASSRRSDATPTGYDCRELMSRHIRGTLFSRDVISHDTCAIVSIRVDLCCVFYSRAASRQTRPIDFARTFGIVFGVRCVCKSLRRELY